MFVASPSFLNYEDQKNQPVTIKIYLNSVNYFSDFCESDGGDVASGQNIPRARAKMLLFKGHDTFCQKMQEKPRSQR